MSAQPQLSPWISATEAAAFLDMTLSQFITESNRPEVRVIKTTVGEHSKRKVYLRDDVERVSAVMSRARLGIGAACRVLAAIEKDGPL
jgi:hypothetical protein